MALIEGGILSTVRGKIGGVVGSTWYGKNVLKSYNGSPKNPRTELQTIQRSLFSQVVKLISSLLPFIKSVNIFNSLPLPAYNLAVKSTLENIRDNSIDVVNRKLLALKPVLKSGINIGSLISVTFDGTNIIFTFSDKVIGLGDKLKVLARDVVADSEILVFDNQTFTFKDDYSISFPTEIVEIGAHTFEIGIILMNEAQHKNSDYFSGLLIP